MFSLIELGLSAFGTVWAFIVSVVITAGLDETCKAGREFLKTLDYEDLVQEYFDDSEYFDDLANLENLENLQDLEKIPLVVQSIHWLYIATC